MLNYIHELVNVDAPDWYINPDFKTILGQKYNSKPLPTALPSLYHLKSETCSTTQLRQSHSKPSRLRQIPKSRPGECMPCATKKLMQVRVCISGAVQNEFGLTQRTKLYTNPKKASELPRHIGIAVKQGFELTHIGVVFSCPLPPASLVAKITGISWNSTNYPAWRTRYTLRTSEGYLDGRGCSHCDVWLAGALVFCWDTRETKSPSDDVQRR